jgi:hypothetical protein
MRIPSIAGSLIARLPRRRDADDGWQTDLVDGGTNSTRQALKVQELSIDQHSA